MSSSSRRLPGTTSPRSWLYWLPAPTPWTWEEQRVEALLLDVAKNHGKDILEWSLNLGLGQLNGRETRFEGSEHPKPARSELSLPVRTLFHAA